MSGFKGQGFQLPNALGALGRRAGQVAHKSKILAIQAAGSQCQQQGYRPHQRDYGYAQVVGGTHHRGARVRNRRHTRFADQSDVFTLQRGLQQRARIELALVVALFVHLVGQFLQGHGLQGLAQRVGFGDAFEVGAGGFGVFTDPVLERRGDGQRPGGHDLVECDLSVAAKIQWGRYQVQSAERGRVHALARVGVSNWMPAARSIRLVRIKGKPTKAVGSSLSMASSRAMPSPSLLALPAQS